MGDLPSSRVTPCKPFQTAGVDYAGPLKVRLSKCRGNVTTKGYIAVFVCFVTHAVHLEAVEDYSSLAFLSPFTALRPGEVIAPTSIRTRAPLSSGLITS